MVMLLPVLLLLVLLVPTASSLLHHKGHPDLADLAQELADRVYELREETFTVDRMKLFFRSDMGVRSRVQDVSNRMIRQCSYQQLGDEAESLADMLDFDHDHEAQYDELFGVRFDITLPPVVREYVTFLESQRTCRDIVSAIVLRLCAQEDVAQAMRKYVDNDSVSSDQHRLMIAFIKYQIRHGGHHGREACEIAHAMAHEGSHQLNVGLVEATLHHELALWGIDRGHDATSAWEDHPDNLESDEHGRPTGHKYSRDLGPLDAPDAGRRAWEERPRPHDPEGLRKPGRRSASQSASQSTDHQAAKASSSSSASEEQAVPEVRDEDVDGGDDDDTEISVD